MHLEFLRHQQCFINICCESHPKQDCPQKRRLPWCSEQSWTASLGSAGVCLVPGLLLSPQAAPQALCSVPKTMQRSLLQNLRTAQQLRTALNSEPIPAMSHIQLTKLSLNTLCCSVLNETKVFRVHQFEPYPTKDMVKKPSLSPQQIHRWRSDSQYWPPLGFMSTCVYQYTQQGEKLISYICGHTGKKNKKKNHIL